MLRLIILLQFFPFFLKAQQHDLKNYYASPLNIPLTLSGNFCEIRSNHFHSGIDLRTQAKEGLPVFAAANGFVSRIKVSSVGYGKALYITHANGTVTVYGHLRQFEEKIQHYVEEKQKAEQKFEIELFPDSTQFSLYQNDQIALSGNSGGSEAPHLHFEIRDRYTEEPLNPLLAGLQVNDTVFPVITHVAVYTNNDGEYQRLGLQETHPVNDSVFVTDDTIRVASNVSKVSIAFAAYDKAFALDSNTVGIYSVALMKDFDTLFNYQYNRFNFNDTKYVNAHIDYEAKINHKLTLERCYLLPGDSFPEFKNAGYGIVNLSDSAIINLKLMVKDFAGNTSTLLLEIVTIKNLASVFSSHHYEDLNFTKTNLLENKNASLTIPKGNLYQNISTEKIEGYNFNVMPKQNVQGCPPGVYDPTEKPILIEPNAINFYSPIIIALDKTVPLHKSAELIIRADSVPPNLHSKALITSINNQNKITGSVGGVYKDGKVKTTIRSFGNYAITVDTLPPVINQLKLTFDSICNCTLLTVKMTDDLSGIKNHEAYVDNEWTIVEYDKKTNRLFHFIKPNLMGPHLLTIDAVDEKENTVFYEAQF